MSIEDVPHWHAPAICVTCPRCEAGYVAVGMDDDSIWYWRCSLCEASGLALVEQVGRRRKE